MWAHFTATRSHTTAGFSVTTASISQWLRQALHPDVVLVAQVDHVAGLKKQRQHPLTPHDIPQTPRP